MALLGNICPKIKVAILTHAATILFNFQKYSKIKADTIENRNSTRWRTISKQFLFTIFIGGGPWWALSSKLLEQWSLKMSEDR